MDNKPPALTLVVKDGRATRRVADPATIAGRVQLLRVSHKWSQAKLAKVAGLAQASVANIERGQTKGGLAVTLAKIAKALNVNVDWLRTGKGESSRRLGSNGDEAEMAAIYDQLSTDNRATWLAIGRTLVHRQEEDNK